jgi:hypothetical protein
MSIDLTRALPYFSPAQSAEETAPLYAYGAVDAPIVRVFSTTLVINYMIDEPGAYVLVRERDVDKNVRDGLHQRCIGNLRAYAARKKLHFDARGTTHIAKLDGQHDASLLLLDELWDPPTRIVDPDGELVAVVPTRGVLAFTGSAARGGIRELRALAKTNERGLSPELFVRRNGAWESFES